MNAEDLKKYDDVINENVALGIAIMDANFKDEENKFKVFNKVMGCIIDELGIEYYHNLYEVFRREYNL